jgi:hypothetical protein
MTPLSSVAVDQISLPRSCATSHLTDSHPKSKNANPDEMEMAQVRRFPRTDLNGCGIVVDGGRLLAAKKQRRTSLSIGP